MAPALYVCFGAIVVEDFPMREEMAKQFLGIFLGNAKPQFPLPPEISLQISLCLQALRYLMVLYGDEKVFAGHRGYSGFADYLRTVAQRAENVYNWPAEDVQFLKQLSPRVGYLDDPDQIFTALTSQVQRVLCLCLLESTDCGVCS
eukprot:TRINITY_DN10377_c0_g1_i1.p1 TRINITY_DN10377_c0_g1~~TRINITY_DN10377_c0_g1_i1.p1  ORF type:complete len:146 (-),score=10.81 TRINITY_DN10377_c0_g1_i1:253-690(-)